MANTTVPPPTTTASTTLLPTLLLTTMIPTGQGTTAVDTTAIAAPARPGTARLHPLTETGGTRETAARSTPSTSTVTADASPWPTRAVASRDVIPSPVENHPAAPRPYSWIHRVDRAAVALLETSAVGEVEAADEAAEHGGTTAETVDEIVNRPTSETAPLSETTEAANATENGTLIEIGMPLFRGVGGSHPREGLDLHPVVIWEGIWAVT